MEKNNFKFFIDDVTIQKGKDKDGKDIMKVGGIASTKDKDSDDEMIDPHGYDVDYFLKNGFLNYNHQAKFNPQAIIGEPTSAKVTKDGLYIEGLLYPESDLATSVYQTTKMLEKSSSKRRMGFSIEGQALERDPADQRKITKAKLTGCALTLNPKNPNTLVNILKGEYHTDDWQYDSDDLPEEAQDLIKKSEDYLVHIEQDGRVLQVDKDLKVKITEEKKVEKALTTAAPVQVESVDQDTKDKVVLPGETKILSKGEVFSEIFNYIYDDDLEKAELLYSLAEAFSQKRTKMKKELTDITSEDIQKSLDFVLNSKADNLEKGGYIKKKSEGEEEDETISDDEYEMMKAKCATYEKSKGMYKGKMKKGGYIKKGPEEVEEEAKDGIEGKKIEKSFTDQINDLEKSHKRSSSFTNDLVKSLAEATDSILERSVDLEKALQTSNTKYEELEKGYNSLKEEYTEMGKRLDKVANTPIPSRTVTSSTYKQHPRLEKSMDSGNELHLVNNKKQILELLDKNAGLDTASPDMRMASAMATFETTGTLDKSVINDLQKSENITIIG